MNNINRFTGSRRIRGQGMTEYIIIVALIAIAAIAVVSLFGGTVRAQVAGMAQEMGGTSSSAQLTNAKTTAAAAATNANATSKKTNLGNYNAAATEVVQ
jgi:Flp pilus assembly pilin Flp